MKTPFQSSERFTAGNALVVTMTTIAIVAGFVGLAVALTGNVGRNVQRSLALREAGNIGDAAMETAFGSWRAVCISKPTEILSGSSFADPSALPTPDPALFPAVKNYALSNYSVKAADESWNPIQDLTVPPPRVFGETDLNFSYYYIASADVTVPTMTSNNPADPADPGNVTVHVKRIFERRRTTLGGEMFNYSDDLEIHPGASMVVTGNVHTNGTLYTASDDLSLFGNTTYTGDWAINFKPGDSRRTSNPGPTATPSPRLGSLPVHQDQARVPYGVDASDYHKLIESIPDPTDPLAKYTFANPSDGQYGAGVQIYIDESNNLEIKNSGGQIVTGSSLDPTDRALYAAITDAVTTNQQITDKREDPNGVNKVRLATLDVGKITAAITDPNPAKKIGNPRVIYIADTSALLTDPSQSYNATSNPYVASQKRAIRLQNGARLPDGGLTIASKNPIYIQGDYNTGRTGTGGGEPPSNTATPRPNPSPNYTPPPPTTPGYDRKPAAVVGDAITILSNNWSDSNPTFSVAKNTTVNAAFIVGIVPTVGSRGSGYSGGAENYPRFLENWSGKSITYYGSMNQLYLSQQGVGKWPGTGSVYNAPARVWNFDTKFLSQPPPGMPYTEDYIRSRWYTE